MKNEKPKVLSIGGLDFPIATCKKLTKKQFMDMHKKTCDARNVDMDHVWEQISGKKSSPKDQGWRFTLDVVNKLISNLQSLNIDRIIFNLLKNQSFQDFIIEANTKDQLFDKGENSLGVSLEDVRGSGYSDLTIRIKKFKGQKVENVTLNDTNAFYESFNVSLNPKSFDIDADPVKEDTNLFDEWGEDIVGLNEENLQELIDMLQDGIIEAITRKAISGI